MSDSDDSQHFDYEYFKPPKTFVKSAIRVMNVLEFFYRTRQPARAAEISRDLDLPVSSTKYLLTSLVESGYLTFDKIHKTYFPSMLFTGLASWLTEIYPSGELLKAIAREVQAEFRCTVSVAVQHDQYMRAMIIETDSTTTPPGYDFRARIPLIGSASGAIALATKSDAEVVKLVAQESRKLPPQLRDDRRDLVLEEIRRVRQRSYATRDHLLRDDGGEHTFLAVAVAIPTANKAPPLALGVCDRKEVFTGREADLARFMFEVIDRYKDRLNA